MSRDDSALTGLAAALLDGADIDWDHAASTTHDGEEKRAIGQLRLLARLADAARTQRASWGPLQIREEVGRGTYGTVYRAWDTRLLREVALKILNATASDAPIGSSIIQEGRLLARIRHPNVVTVYGADTFDERVGIWMEFIDGRTLRQTVETQGPFGPHEASLIGRELCRALAAVHAQGFLHRDVKAQNVMREAGGRTVLMDFGASDSATPEAGATANLRGTPVYLAPELLEGAHATVRTDLYSLGVLLYFLVTGSFPVTGDSLEVLRQRHRNGTRTLLRDARPNLPAAFTRLVDAAIAADPSLRPGSAGALEAELDRTLISDGGTMPLPARARTKMRRVLIGAAGVVALTALAWTGWYELRRSSTREASRGSVAILPFRSLTASSDEDFFSEGITADLIADLAALRDLRVIAGSSMLHYKDRTKTPAEIGAGLGVATVLDATVRKSEDRVRIVTQLIDTATGEQLWSESFESRASDIADLRSDVAHKIAVALKGELSERDMALLGSRTRYDEQTFNLYLKGRHYLGLRTEAASNRAMQYFEQALERTPDFAAAHAGIAEAYTHLGVYGSLPREVAFARAAAAAERAVALDDRLAEAHATLAYARKNSFDWRQAEASFKRSIEFKPGYSTAHHWYSILLTQEGRFPEALAEIKIAQSLDPLSIGPQLQFASLLMMSRRFDDAIAQYERIQRMDANFPVQRNIAMNYAYKGLYNRALTEFDRAAALRAPGAEDQELKADYAYVCAEAGRDKEALATVIELEGRYRSAKERVGGSIAAIYTGLGRMDAALEWLTRATQDKDPEVGYLKVDPKWDPLRRDPRFVELVRGLGFTIEAGGRNGHQ
jgi:eukaryotic-like serine/threonine-protein kinase